MTATNKSDNNKEDVIINGTPERVQQNPLGKLTDAISSVSLTYSTLMDSLGIKDSSSSKNLRVFWSRAYLNHFGKRVDSIAYQLLPERTRDVIKLLPMMGPLVDFQEFITSWTVFIDGAVDSFLHGVDEIETTTTQSRKLYCLVLGTTHAIFATTAVQPSSRLICPTPSRARGDCSGIGRRIWTTSEVETRSSSCRRCWAMTSMMQRSMER